MNTDTDSDSDNNLMHTTPLNVIDLFCGCGGMSKGLTDAGVKYSGWNRYLG